MLAQFRTLLGCQDFGGIEYRLRHDRRRRFDVLQLRDPHRFERGAIDLGGAQQFDALAAVARHAFAAIQHGAEIERGVGADGQFVRAVQNGFNLVHYTRKHASRFTRPAAAGAAGALGADACADCHTPEDLAYGFVSSDRFDSELGKRISFEDSVRRCYARSMNGYAPTIYDPAVRDIRLLARAVAHHLQLGEGALRKRHDATPTHKAAAAAEVRTP